MAAPVFVPSARMAIRVWTTNMPSRRHASITPLTRSRTARPEGGASGEPSTKQRCMSMFSTAVRAGSTA